MKRNVMLLAVAAGLVLAGAVASAAELKLGYLDLDQVFRESRAGKAAAGEMDKAQESKMKEMKLLEDEITRLETDLAKQGTVLSDGARTEREEAIRRKRIDAKRAAEDAERDLRRLQKEQLEKFQKDVLEVIEAIGKAGGYTLILEKLSSGVAYASPAIDITAEIVAAYDKKLAQ